MARPNVLLSLVRAPALPPQHAYFGSRSHTPYDRCLRFGPRVAATPARLAPALPARLWADQTCTGKLISASPIAPRIRLPPRMLTAKPCGFPYALRRLCHAFPALCPARAMLARILLGLRPSLRHLRCRLPGFVRRLHRYY